MPLTSIRLMMMSGFALNRFLMYRAASIMSHPARTVRKNRLELSSHGLNARRNRTLDASLAHKNLHLECGMPLPKSRLMINRQMLELALHRILMCRATGFSAKIVLTENI
jgi:hypothetical protein